MKNTLQLFALSCLVIFPAVATEKSVRHAENCKETNVGNVAPGKGEINIQSVDFKGLPLSPNNSQASVSNHSEHKTETNANITVTLPVNIKENHSVDRTITLDQNAANNEINKAVTKDTVTPELGGRTTRMMNAIVYAVGLQFAWNRIYKWTGTTAWMAQPVCNFALNGSFAKLNHFSRANVVQALTSAGVLYGAYKLVKNYYDNSVEEDIFAINN